jgi:hypothetical protein
LVEATWGFFPLSAHFQSRNSSLRSGIIKFRRLWSRLLIYFHSLFFFCLCEFFPPSLSFLTHSLTLYICSLPLRSRVFACSLAFLHGFVCARESRAISLLLCARHVYNSQFRLYTKYDVLLSPPAIYLARTYFWLQAQLASTAFIPSSATPHTCLCLFATRNELICAPTHTHIYTRSLGGSVYICTDENHTQR